MLNKITYPVCANTFKNWYLSNYNYRQLYYDLGEPSLFDVSLRDGLQGLSKEESKEFTTNQKFEMYRAINFKYTPKNIEIGSLVSEKVLPIFKDTLELYELTEKYQTQNHPLDKIKKQNTFILIPNREKLKYVINDCNISNLSFITSVSSSFQKKNAKMTLEESDNDILTMLHDLDENIYRKYPPFIKLYVSCINECPIEGKIDNDFIVNRILNLNKMNIDSICLSDTCGTLTQDDFEYIVDTCYYFGIPFKKFSLHLHVRTGRETEIENIIHQALERKILNFDVSTLETGGCSVTMDKNRLTPNLSYELYYKSLCKYIIRKNL